MDTEHPPPADDRRRFLTRLGATLAAGFGMVLFGAAPAGGGTQACGIYCYVVGCPGNCCGCAKEFRCVNACDGSETYYCLDRSCANFCASTVC